MVFHKTNKDFKKALEEFAYKCQESDKESIKSKANYFYLKWRHIIKDKSEDGFELYCLRKLVKTLKSGKYCNIPLSQIVTITRAEQLKDKDSKKADYGTMALLKSGQVVRIKPTLDDPSFRDVNEVLF